MDKFNKFIASFVVFVVIFVFIFLWGIIQVKAVGECCNPDSSDCSDGETCREMIGRTIEDRRECVSERGDGYIGKCLPEEAGDSCASALLHCDDGQECRNVGGVSTYCMPERSDGDSDGAPTGSQPSSSGSGVDFNTWRENKLNEVRSAGRGIFTEGLSDECMAFGDCKTCDILKVAANIFRFAFEFVGIAAVLVIFIGGFAYVTSGGNEEQAGKAKKIITAAIIGTLIVFCSWVIINTVLNMTGFNVGGSWWNPSC